jgi:hypothetical protein
MTLNVMAPPGRLGFSRTRRTLGAQEFASDLDLLSRGQVMELSITSSFDTLPCQLVLMRSGTNAQGLPSSGPKDVVGVFTSEAEAQSAAHPPRNSATAPSAWQRGPRALRG